MKFDPYPFQRLGVDHALEFFHSAGRGAKRLYAAPTGCGKSVVELLVQKALADEGHSAIIVTPRDEIVDGMLDKGADPSSIWTPIKLRNRLMTGEAGRPTHLILDEGHHSSAETWRQLDLLTGLAPTAAYTATPYRGTPKSTKELVDTFGQPVWLITYAEAVTGGYISAPEFSMLPLVDDDVVEVRGGEFDVTSLEAATVDRLGDLAEHSRRWYSGRWDRATVFAMPSSEVCVRMQSEMARRGLPCVTVSASTPKAQRRSVFDAVEAGVVALLHITIVQEGVDLRLRRLVDAAPTLSPVKWVQQLGRITRPVSENEAPPEYICTNRNLLRHSYTLEGFVPLAAVVAADRVFPRTERAHTRALGLEALGRFKPASTELQNGLRVHTYALSIVVGPLVVEYCCLVHPSMDPIWAKKVNTVIDGVKTWGKWVECEAPESLTGFASAGAKPPTEKQRKWWDRAAARYGLKVDQEVTKKSFVALPVLSDIGRRFL